MMVKELQDIADIFSGVQISRFIDNNSELRPVIKNKFINENILDYTFENISTDINQKYFSKKGDIIISLSQPNSVSIMHKNGFIITMYFAIIRLKEDFDTSFIYHLLDSDEFHKKLYTLLEGGNLRVIKVSDLKKIKINIPNIENQKKYGELLNLIDKKNNLLENKKECNDKFKEYIIKTQWEGE